MELPFKISEEKPSKALLPYVKRYVYFEYDGPGNFVNQVAPSGTIFLNHFYGDRKTRIIKGDTIITDPADVMILGQVIRKDVQVEYRDTVRNLLVEFTPTGFYELFHYPTHKINDKEIDIRVLGYNEFVDELTQLSDPKAKKDCFETFFERLATTPAAIDPHIKEAVNNFLQDPTQSTLAIDDHYVKTEAGKKKLYRLFRKYVGLSPKQFQRVAQLNHIIHLININDFESLSELALSAGYYDQSDFIKHFKSYVVAKPSKFINRKEEVLYKFMGKKS